MNSILTPWEAVRFGPVEKEYPTSHMERYILPVERKLFRECLSIELYNQMLGDMISHSNLSEWNKNSTYSEGDLVIFYGCVIVSMKDDNSDLPGSDASPSDPDFYAWVPAQKFSKDCFNGLWEMHLRSYLSHEVTLKAIRKTTHSASARGIVEHVDMNAGSRSVSRTSLIDWKREVQEDAHDLLEEMKYWILASFKDGCEDFKSVPFVKKSCESGVCNVSAKRTRRMFFRR